MKVAILAPAALLEFGYAISQGIQILTLEPATDPNIAPYTRLLSDVFGELDLTPQGLRQHVERASDELEVVG